MNDFGKSKTEGERNSIAKRGQIVGLWKSGKSINEICAEIGCKRETAWKWIERFVCYLLGINDIYHFHYQESR